MIKKIRDIRKAREEKFLKEKRDALNETVEFLTANGFANIRQQRPLIKNLAIRLVYHALRGNKDAAVKVVKTGVIEIPDYIVEACIASYLTRKEWNALKTLNNSNTLDMATMVSGILEGAEAGLNAAWI